MTRSTTLALAGMHHGALRAHLYPGDGNESVAFLACGRRDSERKLRLTVQDVFHVPHDVCTIRTPDQVTWPTDAIAPLLDRAAALGLSLIKVHSHPGGYSQFSDIDDAADAKLFPLVHGWVEADVPHGSAVMLPCGRMFGRLYDSAGKATPIDLISAAGDDLHFWFSDEIGAGVPAFAASHAQAFDIGTIQRLQRLTFGAVGASGTGSPTIEQLARLGAAEIVSVDDDRMEARNVNRVINSTMEDVRQERFKVDVLADAVERMGLGTNFRRFTRSLWDLDVVRAIAECDVLFGCMDTVDGRFLLNTIATYYNIPYFDIGVRLDAVPDGPRKGTIREVCGTINYIQPGRSSLMSRGLFTMQEVAAAGLRRKDPAAYARQIKDGYIKGVQGHRPAVISLNMLGSSLAVNEFLARLHPFREEPNGDFAAVTFSLSSMEIINDPESAPCPILKKCVGRGDVEPLVGLMDFARRSVA
jgi:ThiF family/Prokaryotic homologs of the JAB domain